MNIAESLNFLLSFVLYKEVTNLVMACLLSITIVLLYYIAIKVKHKFSVVHRIGFIFLCLGLTHNVLLRLSNAAIVDEFMLINVPNSLGYIVVQVGIITIALNYAVKYLCSNDK